MAGTMIVGTGIPLFQLLAQRGAVRLEAKGIKVSRGPMLTGRLAKHFGVSRKQVLAHLDALIAAAEAKLVPGDIYPI